MKTLIYRIFIALTFSVALISCSNGGSGNTGEIDSTKTIISGADFFPGSGWNLEWSDEFQGDSIDMKNWNFQELAAGTFNNEWQRYTNSYNNAYVEDDNLVIKAIHEGETHGMDQYTSARLNTANKQTWKYGKIAARIKLPYSKGLWPAFWMLGADIDENGGSTPWPQCGEIDILELYGSRNDGVVEANMHYANSSNSHSMMGSEDYKLKNGKFADDFHVFELEWNEKELIWSVDGEEYASTSITSDELTEFHEEFFILFNIAVIGADADESIFPQYMYVDWIRVFQK